MTKSTRTVLLVVLGLFGFGFLATGLLVVVLVRAAEGFGGSNEWTEDAVAERELPAVYGVRLPVKPLRYQSRQLGFQDAYFEVLVQLPPGAADAFLDSNHLARGAEVPLDADVLDAVRALDPATPALKSFTVELREALKVDGGSWQLHRSGELLEGPGVLWVHLTAFET
ncbi:MAG: hypothetical protein Q8L48_24695 [Archangium sp.]|nr:hypothetical protein [Archangium sp.]